MGWSSRRTRRAAAVVMATAFAVTLNSCAVPRWQHQLGSVNTAGTTSANGLSQNPVLSPDGTKVLFESDATDLGPTDTNGIPDLYVRDLTAGTTSLVTVNAAGTDAGNARSAFGIFSPDSTKIAFASRSTNLATPATSGTRYDAYVRDLVTGQTTLVSVSTAGTGGADADAWPVRFSPDSSRILFETTAENIAGPTPLANGAIFERNLVTGQTRKLADGNASSYSPSGDVVAFHRSQEVWVLDTSTGAQTSISESEGVDGAPYWHRAVVSHDGRKVAFAMTVVENGVGRTDIYVHDRVMHTTTLATPDIDGTGGSNGGVVIIEGFHPSDRHKLLFTSNGSNLAANDTNGSAQDVFIRDLSTGTTTLLSTNSAGTASANGPSPYVKWVGDGSKVAMVTMASDMGANDTNAAWDVYTREVATVRYSLVSANAANDNSGEAGSGQFQRPGGPIAWGMSLSADGTRLAFGSNANNLGPPDTARGTTPESRYLNHDIYISTFTAPAT